MKTGIALMHARWRASRSKGCCATNTGAPSTGWTTSTATGISSARAHRWKATSRQRNDVSLHPEKKHLRRPGSDSALRYNAPAAAAESMTLQPKLCTTQSSYVGMCTLITLYIELYY